MQIIKEFIHIGYPKTMSTSLQRSFFPILNDVYYLGVGDPQKKSNIDYIDSDINSFFEYYIRFSNDYVFNERKEHFTDVFNKHRSLAIQNNKKIMGVSLEHLGFKFLSQDIETFHKIKRLREFFDQSTVIVLLIRNQFDLIKSLYSENVRNGITLTFEEFLKYCYFFHESNFVHDLFYERVLQSLETLFDNIKVFKYEEFLDDVVSKKNQILNNIGESIGSEDKVTYLEHFNEKLDNSTLYHKYQHNLMDRHDLGLSNYEHPELHRLRVFLRKSFPVEYVNLYQSAQIKNAGIQYAKKRSEYEQRAIKFNVNSDIVEKLRKMFITSNEKLAKKFKIDLPNSYFKMEF